MLFRGLFYLILAILLISVLRGVIGFIASMFTNAAVGPERRAGAPNTKETIQTEALKKDPVCGTFVAPSTAVRKERDGKTFYFCSPACRDKF
ncbi:MAG: YHS domain-containing protein [Bryobacteraceae bacterium]